MADGLLLVLCHQGMELDIQMDMLVRVECQHLQISRTHASTWSRQIPYPYEE
jgi:hypothetical protein